jgi:2-polyprenyl-3-methyl-5-hydroxy-6-metoxy-1,4-benzoquinol methylase
MKYEDILKLAYSYWNPKVFFTALKIGVFNCLSEIPKSIEEISDQLNTNFKGTEIVLNTLVTLKLVKKNEREQFYILPEIHRYLSQNSPDYRGEILYYFDSRMIDFLEFDEFLYCKDPTSYKESKPIPMTREKLNKFILGMENITRELVPSVIKLLPLDGKKRILDLGAAAGNYTLAMAEKCPNSEITYYDLAEVEPIAKKFIKEQQDNIKYMTGNFLTDDIGIGYDFVWVSQIIHRTGDKNTQHLLRKIHSALKKNGLIAIHDYLLNDSKISPEFATLLNVFWFVTTGGNGKAYSIKEVKDVLEEIGFRTGDIIETPASTRILIAKKL